jgi:hypothetical protein
LGAGETPVRHYGIDRSIWVWLWPIRAIAGREPAPAAQSNPARRLARPITPRPLRISKPGDERRELVNEAAQELARAFIRDRTVCVYEAGPEADMRLPAHDEHAQAAKNLPQMLLAQLPCRVRRARCR